MLFKRARNDFPEATGGHEVSIGDAMAVLAGKAGLLWWTVREQVMNGVHKISDGLNPEFSSGGQAKITLEGGSTVKVYTVDGRWIIQHEVQSPAIEADGFDLATIVENTTYPLQVGASLIIEREIRRRGSAEILKADTVRLGDPLSLASILSTTRSLDEIMTSGS